MKNCGAQPLLTFAFYIFNFAFLLFFLSLMRYDACWGVSALFAGRFSSASDKARLFQRKHPRA